MTTYQRAGNSVAALVMLAAVMVMQLLLVGVAFGNGSGSGTYQAGGGRHLRSISSSRNLPGGGKLGGDYYAGAGSPLRHLRGPGTLPGAQKIDRSKAVKARDKVARTARAGRSSQNQKAPWTKRNNPFKVGGELQPGTHSLALGPTKISYDYVPAQNRDTVILFLPGLCGTKQEFDAQLAAFKGKYSMAFVDPAGHGDSTTSRTSYTMADYGKDVAKVVNQLGAKKVILVGHSLGGPIALEAAKALGASSKPKTKVLGVIGLDTLGDNMPANEVDAAMAEIPAQGGFHQWMTNLAGNPAFIPPAKSQFRNQLKERISKFSPDLAVASLRSFYAYDMAKNIGEVKAPVYAINSTQPISYADKAGVKVSWVTGSGHYVHRDNPTAVNELLRQRIATLTGGAS